MKLIISGGRDYHLTARDIMFLDSILGVEEVVEGECRGADLDGKRWAERRGIPIKPFPAEDYGSWPACGPLRNRAMAEYADAVVLFPGGRGTTSMRVEATRQGLGIFEPPAARAGEKQEVKRGEI